MKSVVSEKSRITIPKPLRERLGLRTGQILDSQEDRGRLVATNQPLENPIESVYGFLELGRATDATVRSLLGKADAT